MSMSCRAFHPSTKWTAEPVTIHGVRTSMKRKIVIYVGNNFHFELAQGQVTDFINQVADTYERLEGPNHREQL